MSKCPCGSDNPNIWRPRHPDFQGLSLLIGLEEQGDRRSLCLWFRAGPLCWHFAEEALYSLSVKFWMRAERSQGTVKQLLQVASGHQETWNQDCTCLTAVICPSWQRLRYLHKANISTIFWNFYSVLLEPNAYILNHWSVLITQ